MTHTNTLFRRINALVVLLALLLSLLPVDVPAYAASAWSPTLLVNTESFQVIDNSDSAATQLELRFGDVVGQRLLYDRTNLRFQFTRSLLVSGSITATGSITAQTTLSGQTLVVSGQSTHSGSAMFRTTVTVKGALSGQTLRVTGNADVHGALTASGGVRTDGNLTINDDVDSNNAVLTFGNTTASQTITYLNTAQKFQFSKAISVIGTISGSALNVDRNITAGGTLTVTGAVLGMTTITAKNTLSGQTLVVSGQSTHSGSAMFRTSATVKGTLSGQTLRASGNADVIGIFSVSGAVHFDANLSLNDDQGAVDAVLTFGNATTNQALTYVNTTQRFKFSDDLDIIGAISGTTIRSWGSVPNTFSGAIITDSSFSGVSFFGSGLGSCSNATSDKLLYNPSTGKFSCGSDQSGGTGGGGISYANAEGMFVNQGGDTMTGGLSINVTSSDIVKTTTGVSGATDFSIAGSTLTNVTSNNDAININEGTVPGSNQGTTSTSTVTTSAAAGAGAHTILRDDGRFVVFLGNASTTVNIWDGIAGGAMTAATAATTAIGAGAMSLKRPDGKYLVIPGGGSTAGFVYDPFNITANAGLTLTSCTATTGTNAFLVASGSYVIMCGGSANWGLYNATANIYTAEPVLGASFGAGAHAIARDDGSFLVFAGGNTTTHWLYTPYTNTWTLNPITSNAPTITTAAFSIRRADGKFLVIPGAQNSSYIYDPMPGSANSQAGTMTQQTASAGFGPTAALTDGAGAIWRQDGKYLMILGSTTATNIIDPSRTDANQFTTGPTIAGATPGAGAHMFMNARGTVQVILGGAATTTSVYDMGFVLGGTSTATGSIYESECITSPSLGSGSRMEWNADADQGLLTFQVRTGLNSCSGNYRSIANNGDLIYPVAGQNRAQFRVYFKRTPPKFVDQEWGLRRGISQTRYRRANKDPTLFDISIRNTIGLHRTQFEFGGSTDASGPVAVNIQNDRNKNLQIALATSIAYGTSINTTQQGFYNGVFINHPVLSTAAGIGTIVLRKPDKKYVILPGQTAQAGAGAAMLYDANTQTTTTMTAVPTVRVSTGALAFKRPDGKFFVAVGGGSRVTNIYDPVADTFTAGPLMTQSVADGSQPIPLPNGNILILHGGYRRTTTVYNPFTNTTMSGSLTNQVIGRGSLVIPRPNGQYLVIPGTSTPACALQAFSMIFDPYTMMFINNAAAPVVTGTGPGAVAFERSDGQWMILKGGATAATCAGLTTTNIYNPFTNRMIAGPALTIGTRHGSQVLPRPDGSWLITNGGGLNTTQIYYEKSGAFTAELSGPGGIGTIISPGPAAAAVIGTGSVAFQRDDGKFMVTAGANVVASAGTTTAMMYDAGWVANGFYRSELINIPDLDSTSTLTWKATPSYANVSASVRTGTSALMTQVTSGRPINRPGDLIVPGTAETWLQTTFTLSRTFPSYPGIYTDVWWNGGSTNNVAQRSITTPILTEFSVGKDKNLVDLKSDKVSVFRVSSNGDVYAGSKGSLFSGGADLAERYTSADNLQPGEVVTIDFTDSHGVRRSTSAYQPEVLGVVSTNPGFVAGAYTKGSFPVALVGRVPVKVSLENGPIHTGDRLVASSLPGYAAKAVRAGRTIGMALEGLDVAATEPCAADKKKQCGTLMLFVNLSDYQGPAQ